ncbi:MAG: DUF5335 family protein [Armatimonadetes bacterium]|nr:DUF5335 family protein [Armatimonadota bacterium]
MARDIPQQDWHEFLLDFTDDNQGRKATVKIGDLSIGDGGEDDVFVLTGVEAGVQAEDEDTVVVELADLQGPDQTHVTHRFEDVSALRVLEEEGGTEGLEIETQVGTRATLRLEEEVPVVA